MLKYLIVIIICVNVMTESIAERKLIKLELDNFVSIRGVINGHTSDKFMSDIMNIRQDNITIFITSPGGSVMDGYNMIQMMKSLKNYGKRITCIADNAASMAFAIFQACDTRYIIESSILMQHQTSLTLQGQLKSVLSLLSLVTSMDKELNKMQANRLGMSIEEFNDKVAHDWWLFNEDIISNGVADEMVDVICNFDINNNNESIEFDVMFIGKVNVTYSRCPLMRNPTSVIIKN